MIHQCDFVPAQKFLGMHSQAQFNDDTRADAAGGTETVTAWRCRFCLRLVKSDAVPVDGIFAAAEATVAREAAAMFDDVIELAPDPQRSGALSPQEQVDLLRRHGEAGR